MQSIVRHGRSVEEAIENALSELGARREDVAVEILQQGSQGFLGLVGQREARVRVTVKQSKKEVGLDFLRQVARAIVPGVDVSATEEDGWLVFDIEGDDVGLLIGYHGKTLGALQYLTRIATARINEDDRGVIVDVAGYRRRRRSQLERMAASSAERVRRTRRSIRLEPMVAQERKVIHLALKDVPHVVTQSEGVEPFRRVVISPAPK